MKFNIFATIGGQKCEFQCFCEDKDRAELMKTQILSMLCAWSAILTELRVEV